MHNSPSATLNSKKMEIAMQTTMCGTGMKAAHLYHGTLQSKSSDASCRIDAQGIYLCYGMWFYYYKKVQFKQESPWA